MLLLNVLAVHDYLASLAAAEVLMDSGSLLMACNVFSWGIVFKGRHKKLVGSLCNTMCIAWWEQLVKGLVKGSNALRRLSCCVLMRSIQLFHKLLCQYVLCLTYLFFLYLLLPSLSGLSNCFIHLTRLRNALICNSLESFRRIRSLMLRVDYCRIFIARCYKMNKILWCHCWGERWNHWGLLGKMNRVVQLELVVRSSQDWWWWLPKVFGWKWGWRFRMMYEGGGQDKGLSIGREWLVIKSFWKTLNERWWKGRYLVQWCSCILWLIRRRNSLTRSRIMKRMHDLRVLVRTGVDTRWIWRNSLKRLLCSNYSLWLLL